MAPVTGAQPSPADVQVTFCATVIDQMVSMGLRHAVVAPGSRSTPMALAIAADERVTVQGAADLLMSFCGGLAAFSSGFVKAAWGFHLLADAASLAAGLLLVATRHGRVWVGQDFWPITVEKRVSVPKSGARVVATYQLTNGQDRPVTLWFGVEFNIHLPAGGAEAQFRTGFRPGLAESVRQVLRLLEPDTVNSPFGTTRLIWLTAVRSPNFLTSWFSSIIAR